MFDPPVYFSAASTMNAIKFCVARGAFFYVGGHVPADRALALANRFHERYDLPQSVGAREHRRRRGQARFSLHFWPRENALGLDWWLLRSEGSHPLLRLETWRDAREDRLAWPWWFELCQLPVDPALRDRYRLPDGAFRIASHTWTWRISPAEMDRLRILIRHAAQHRDDRLPQLIRSLQLCPGDRGIRGDVHRLYRYIGSQCAKRKVTAPVIPSTIRWSTGKRGPTVPLSTLIRRAESGATHWFPERSGGASESRDTVSSNPTTGVI